jgi:hypothetical protein
MDTPREPAPIYFPAEDPELPVRRKSCVRRIVFLLLIGFGVILSISLIPLGNSVEINAKGIGPLDIGRATKHEMQKWATGSSSSWLTQKGNPPVHFKGQLWQYRCSGQSTVSGATCRTLFGLRNGRVVTVETNSPQVRTAVGTRAGRSLASTINEQGTWSGWGAKCPRVILPSPKGVTFLALVSRDAAHPKGFVSNLYLSVTPSSFSYCAK